MFKKTVEQLGQLDVVIANAGIGGNEEFNEFEDGQAHHGIISDSH